MPSIDKKAVVRKQPTKLKEKVDVRDFNNDPYFVKKDEESRLFMEKHGFPEELLKKK